ncbi:MAG: phosphate-starvation-inducible PsiE family protein [Chloroflexota bacterium]
MFKFIKEFNYERVASRILMVLMGLVTFLSILDLIYIIYQEILDQPVGLIKVDRLEHVLGNFLWVLIALELFATVRAYIRHRHFHVERILLVSLVAVSRKLIVLNIHELGGATLVGLAAIVAALCIGYFLIRRCPPRSIREEEEFERAYREEEEKSEK